MLEKDGSLVSGWRYRGPDVGAATPEELNALSSHLNHALLPYTDDWMFHVDAIRRPAVAYPPSRFPDPVTQLIDDERRAAYAAQASRQFETEYFLIATHRPPTDVVSRLKRLFVQQTEHRGFDWHELLDRFATELVTLENRLAAALQLERLTADGLLSHLHECLTGLAHPVRTPPAGSYLNVVLADQELVGGFEPKIGRMAIRVVALQGYPHASEPGRCDFLNMLPFAFRWSNRLIPLGPEAAAKQIRRHQLEWFKKRKGAAAWVQDLVGGKRDARPGPDDELWMDQDARRMAGDAAQALAENASGAVRFCFHTAVAVVTDSDPARADHAAREILKALNDAGFPGRIETVNALDAYLGSLPGHGYPNLRRPLLSTRNAADLLPVTSVWPGLRTNPSPFFPPDSPPLLWAATGGTPFRVNLHDSDVGHTLVLGKTGSGKSVLLALIAAQFRRYPRAQVFVFDVGYSMWPLAQGAGAAHYDLAAARPDALRFQPLAGIDAPGERAWAAEWLETALALQGVTVTPPLRTRIDRALELVARNERPHRTLTELAVQLQDDTLAAALRPYTVAGNYGQLLDAGADDLADGPVPGVRAEAPAGAGRPHRAPGAALSVPAHRSAPGRPSHADRDRRGVVGAHALALRRPGEPVAPDAPQAECRGGARDAKPGPARPARAAAHARRLLSHEDLPAESRRDDRRASAALPRPGLERPRDRDHRPGDPQTPVLLQVPAGQPAVRARPRARGPELPRPGARGGDGGAEKPDRSREGPRRGGVACNLARGPWPRPLGRAAPRTSRPTRRSN